MGRILGVLCLSGLRFFLGGLFFCEKNLYILLCFHQFLHLITRLAVGWISSFLLRKQCGVFCVQFFYLWQLFQSSFVKSGFCRPVQCDLLPVFFQKLFAVPGLTVGIIHRSCFGIVDDVRPQDGNLRHALLCGLDGIAQLMVLCSCRIYSLLHFFDAADFIFLQEDQGLGHLFQIVAFCPSCIAFALALGEFRLNVHQQMERLLFWRLLLMRTVFGFSSNDRLDFIFAVPCAQRPKTDKAFLSCAFDGSVLSSLDLIALLFQLLKKGFKVCGLLVQQDIVDYGAQLFPDRPCQSDNHPDVPPVP